MFMNDTTTTACTDRAASPCPPACPSYPCAQRVPAYRFRAAQRLVLLVAACLASTAWARLGGTVDTLEAEKPALRIRSQFIEHRAGYDVHHLLREDGEIRQFSDPAGHIFAVAWQTHVPVPLADLLEPTSATVMTHVTARPAAEPAAGRHGASARVGDRVVHVLKLSHLFMGSAHLVTKIPAGVDPKELR